MVRPGQRRTAERLRRGWEERVKIGAEIIPKVFINAGQSLSQPAADSSLYAREPMHGALMLRGSLSVLPRLTGWATGDICIGRRVNAPPKNMGEARSAPVER